MKQLSDEQLIMLYVGDLAASGAADDERSTTRAVKVMALASELAQRGWHLDNDIWTPRIVRVQRLAMRPYRTQIERTASGWRASNPAFDGLEVEAETEAEAIGMLTAARLIVVERLVKEGAHVPEPDADEQGGGRRD